MRNPGDHSEFFFRYEDQKLYQGYAEEEFLVFDYSLQVNDTLFPGIGPVYVVTGIDSVLLTNGESRKRMITQCVAGAWGDTPIYWIEGFPSSAGLQNIYEICAADAGSALLCVLENGEHLYSNPDLDSCWYLPVATTEIAFTNISISPNPVERWLTISDPDQKVAEVSISNLLGQLVYKGSELNINVDHIPQGYYLVSIFPKDGHVKTEKILRLYIIISFSPPHA